MKIRTLRHIDRNLWVQIVQLFSNNEVDLFVVGFNELVNVSMFGNNHISAINIGIEDSCSECEVMGGLSDHDCVIRFGKCDGLIIGVFWKLKVSIFRIVQNTLNILIFTLNL